MGHGSLTSGHDDEKGPGVHDTTDELLDLRMQRTEARASGVIMFVRVRENSTSILTQADLIHRFDVRYGHAGPMERRKCLGGRLHRPQSAGAGMHSVSVKIFAEFSVDRSALGHLNDAGASEQTAVRRSPLPTMGLRSRESRP